MRKNHLFCNYRSEFVLITIFGFHKIRLAATEICSITVFIFVFTLLINKIVFLLLKFLALTQHKYLYDMTYFQFLIRLLIFFQTVMEFRHPDGRLVPVVLPPRSLLLMKGESRYLWTHGWAGLCQLKSIYLDLSLKSIDREWQFFSFSVPLRKGREILNFSDFFSRSLPVEFFYTFTSLHTKK